MSISPTYPTRPFSCFANAIDVFTVSQRDVPPSDLPLSSFSTPSRTMYTAASRETPSIHVAVPFDGLYPEGSWATSSALTWELSTIPVEWSAKHARQFSRKTSLQMLSKLMSGIVLMNIPEKIAVPPAFT